MATTSKQDRQGARTTADLERKYKFGKSFSEVMGIATDSQRAAEKAASAVGDIDKKLNPTDIFNLLTNNGQIKSVYKGDDGEIYINATYIKSGEFVADLIKSGVIKSVEDAEYSLTVDLNTGIITVRATENQNRFSYMHSGAIGLRNEDYIFDLSAYGFSIFDAISRNALSANVDKYRSCISGLTAPVNDSDAVNKAYVDALEARVAALEAAINSQGG